MRYSFHALAFASLAIAAGCATVPIMGDPAAQVTAVAETRPVGTVKEDAADDPAIWRNNADPAASLIVATDKKAGLYVYDLEGQQKSFAAGGLLNNVDLLDLGQAGVLVAASDRADPLNSKVALYRLDPTTAQLISLGRFDTGPGEAYGLCLYLQGDNPHVVAPIKDGTIRDYAITSFGSPNGAPNARLDREMKVATQPEGCVVDPRNETLYVGEENAGIWRFAAGETEGELVAPIDNRQLVADVEGLAIAPEGEDGGWLVASSQGDNAYARYRLPDMAPAGRFRIVSGAFGAAEETDGIALDTRSFGPNFPGGLFVAQDGKNAPAAQNFKLASWQEIQKALDSWTPPTQPTP